MSTHIPGFQSFFSFLHHFAMAKLATSSIRVKQSCLNILTAIRTKVILMKGIFDVKESWLPWKAAASHQDNFLTCLKLDLNMSSDPLLNEANNS